MKWRPTCYKMAPDKFKNGAQYAMKSCRYEMKLKNGAQCFCNKFDCRLFISKFSQFAFYLPLTLSHFKKLSPTLLQVLQALG